MSSDNYIICLDLGQRHCWAAGLLSITYDLPTNRENHIHRTSQGVWFGHKGVAINTVTEEDKRTLWDIETFYISMLLTSFEELSHYMALGQASVLGALRNSWRGREGSRGMDILSLESKRKKNQVDWGDYWAPGHLQWIHLLHPAYQSGLRG